MGEDYGTLHYMENTKTPAFVQRTGSANPFNGIDVGWVPGCSSCRDIKPALGDIDGDGTLRPRPTIDML